MSLINQFHAGGFFMYFILLFGVLSLAFIVERTIALYLRFKTAPTDFRKNLLAFTAAGDFKGAKAYIQEVAAGTSIGNIAMVGCNMRAVGSGDEALQARMDEQLTKEVSSIDKRTGFLAMFGNVATLFGLLGTVTGLISSFAGVAAASPVERANLLSQGISEALNSTAFGLVAAIPALVAFAVFQNKTEKLIGSLMEDSSEIYHDYLFYSENMEKAETVEHMAEMTNVSMTREVRANN